MPSPAEIRELRQQHGLTMKAAAELLEVSPAAYKHWEYGIRKMSKPVWKLMRILLERKS